MICKICNKELLNYHSLAVHLTNQHKNITHEEYYVKYVDDKKCYCLTCGSLVPFINLRLGYKKHCSIKCARNDVNIKNKIENTMNKKYGVKYYTISSNFKAQAENTKQIKYNNKNYTNREKSIETTIKNNGGVGFSSESVNTKFKNTMKHNYGVEYAMQCNTLKRKYEDVLNSKYGVRNPLQCKEIRDKTKKKYFYNDINFDSSWEIAFYIYLKDHHIRFEYHPICIDYFYPGDNKIHKYEVDFKLFNNSFIEIKNIHLLNNMKENKKSLEYYKYECMLKNNVKIITDCSKYINYVNQKYGKKYINSFKTR
jgi:hypothetical protein